MSLESGTYISDLNTANPAAGDPKAQGDDHIRLIKTLIKNSFPNITGAMTASQAEANTIVGINDSPAVPTNGTNFDCNRVSEPSKIYPLFTKFCWLHFYGIATGVPSESNIGTLPVGYRPLVGMTVPAVVSKNSNLELYDALVSIATNGTISISTPAPYTGAGYTLGPNDAVYFETLIPRA